MTLRDEILDAAGRLIRARGAAGATTKEIAAAAGCAEGSLYRHFPDKGQLLLAAVERHLPDVRAALALDDGDLRASLERLAVALVDYFGKLLPLSVGLLADVALAEQNRQRLRDGNLGPHRLWEHLAARFSAAQAAGRIRPSADPLALAATLSGACFQYAYMRFFSGAVPLWASDADFARAVVAPLVATAAPEGTPDEPPAGRARGGKPGSKAKRAAGRRPRR